MVCSRQGTVGRGNRGKTLTDDCLDQLALEGGTDAGGIIAVEAALES